MIGFVMLLACLAGPWRICFAEDVGSVALVKKGSRDNSSFLQGKPGLACDNKKVTFWRVIGNLLHYERRPFATQKAVFRNITFIICTLMVYQTDRQGINAYYLNSLTSVLPS